MCVFVSYVCVLVVGPGVSMHGSTTNHAASKAVPVAGAPARALTRLVLPLPPARREAALAARLVVAAVAAHALEALLLQGLQAQPLALLELLCGGGRVFVHVRVSVCICLCV